MDEICDLSNLEHAFQSCLCGKREKLAPQLAFLTLDSFLLKLQAELRSGQNYHWGPYKDFFVSDPKRRKISSAPFIDRVAHRAIYNVLNPILDQRLIKQSYACREGKGNGRAIGELYQTLSRLDEFWAVKLDVAKYFASVHHGRLMGKLFSFLPDESVVGLIKGLLKNHPAHVHGVGLPLGNLTSQIFANFYLAQLDDGLTARLGERYFRYMDDIVIVARSESEAQEALALALEHGRIEKLKFPARKRYWLGKNTPIPFLGFLVGKSMIRPLNRNRRSITRKVRAKVKLGLLPSQIEASLVSYRAWRDFPYGLIQEDQKKISV
jgi:RNA-directed DNA polymerase